MSTPRNPYLTVDVLIEIDKKIVLIERKNAPLGWAIPGGFVDYGESVEEAAIREAEEETGLKVTLTDLLYVYSNPYRDERGHATSVAFIATAEGVPVGADDATNAELFSPYRLPKEIVFDHAEILKDYRRFKKTGERPTPLSKWKGVCKERKKRASDS